MTPNRRAVIDIGSNSIRLVVYAGSVRSPVAIYNEKSRVSLGACLNGDGIIDDDTLERAVAAIARLHRVAEMMEVDWLRVIATAATREAKNGRELVRRAAKLGIKIDVIDGQSEALASGMGIISEHPDADGYVGDLGGGSLELVRIKNGQLGESVSLPLGTLRIGQFRDLPAKQVAQQIQAHLATANGGDTFAIEPDLPFYLIGGSWRSLARLHMFVTEFPLAVLSNYRLPGEAPADLLDLTRNTAAVTETKVVPGGRLAALPDATALLAGIARLFQPSHFLTSISGIREGLLYAKLKKAEQRQDPLIAAVRFEGKRLSRFSYHGDALADWIAPLFVVDTPEMARLRLCACLLADSAWQVSPEYRATHSLNFALDGSWPSIGPHERAILAAALMAAHGQKSNWPNILLQLAEQSELQRAMQWGLAIRLALRLDGGSGAALTESRFETAEGKLQLILNGDLARLRSGSVERRLGRLASSLGHSGSEVVSTEGQGLRRRLFKG
jgi:exopolyphosphatase / guanosine-5'-triphosphate,3'-diphosphate pyrophosphatase